MTAALIAEIMSRGQAAWPGVALDAAAVADFVAALPAVPALTHAADLYLACACSLGQPAAITHFENCFVAAVPVQIRHLGTSADFGDEVRQRLRVKLLTGAPGQPPKIAGYAGLGPLAGWVRASAVRVALDLHRDHRAAPSTVAAADWLVTHHDPELAFLKAQHREVFGAALLEALAALSERDRTVLRLHVCVGLSAVRIGAVLDVNHATVSRWLQAARTTIFTDTRRRLTERLRLAPGEFESLVRLIESQLDVSMARALGG